MNNSVFRTFSDWSGVIPEKGGTWKLIDVLREASGFLERRGVESPRLNAERLLASVLNVGRMDLYLRFDQPLHPGERESYKSMLVRRAGHEPLQYILGETEFMSLPFRVTAKVLIPRPETEILVERVVEDFRNSGPVRILDVGFGSGAIAIALAKHLPEANVDGIDVDPEILDLAESNSERNGVAERVRFVVADVLKAGFENLVSPPYDAVVSNPPYVSVQEWESLPKEIRDFEPRRALCDEGDGLAFYRVIAGKAKTVLSENGRLYFEIGFGRKDRVFGILVENGYTGLESHPDLNGIDRVVRSAV
jgi:release factor glutamine methyltransferase